MIYNFILIRNNTIIFIYINYHNEINSHYWKLIYHYEFIVILGLYISKEEFDQLE